MDLSEFPYYHIYSGISCNHDPQLGNSFMFVGGVQINYNETLNEEVVVDKIDRITDNRCVNIEVWLDEREIDFVFGSLTYPAHRLRGGSWGGWFGLFVEPWEGIYSYLVHYSALPTVDFNPQGYEC